MTKLTIRQKSLLLLLALITLLQVWGAIYTIQSKIEMREERAKENEKVQATTLTKEQMYKTICEQWECLQAIELKPSEK